MNKIALLSAASALAMSVAGVASAATPLWYQNDPVEDAGFGVISDNFPPANDSYDDQAADDFKVPAAHHWTINEVDVTGRELGNPPTSENVFFYKDSPGLPASLIYQCYNIPGLDIGGSIQITLPASCGQAGMSGGSTGKTYWVSVQANTLGWAGGEWDWDMNSTVRGHLSAWQSPPSIGFPQCVTWDTTANCWGYADDYMFALRGVDISSMCLNCNLATAARRPRK